MVTRTNTAGQGESSRPPVAARRPTPVEYTSLTIYFDREFFGHRVWIRGERMDADGHVTTLEHRTTVTSMQVGGKTRYVAHFPRIEVPRGGANDRAYLVCFKARDNQPVAASADDTCRLVAPVYPNQASEADATGYRPTWW